MIRNQKLQPILIEKSRQTSPQKKSETTANQDYFTIKKDTNDSPPSIPLPPESHSKLKNTQLEGKFNHSWFKFENEQNPSDFDKYTDYARKASILLKSLKLEQARNEENPKLQRIKGESNESSANSEIKFSQKYG